LETFGKSKPGFLGAKSYDERPIMTSGIASSLKLGDPTQYSCFAAGKSPEFQPRYDFNP
jgi:hypothetical protein